VPVAVVVVVVLMLGALAAVEVLAVIERLSETAAAVHRR
jgi:hypothetical protein